MNMPIYFAKELVTDDNTALLMEECSLPLQFIEVLGFVYGLPRRRLPTKSPSNRIKDNIDLRVSWMKERKTNQSIQIHSHQ